MSDMPERPLDPEEQDPNCYDFGVWSEENGKAEELVWEFLEEAQNATKPEDYGHERRELIIDLILNTDEFDRYQRLKYQEHLEEIAFRKAGGE